ncbi:MAG: MarR family transcriptional regulator [Anaerolineales bacterium]|nr:MarR family transcriptional regulator [Anaerolineales bacterium]
MNIPDNDNPTMQRAMDTYVKLTRSADSLSTRLIKKQTLDDLPPSQSDHREALSHLGPLSQTEIGAKLLKSGGNISLIIDNLEKKKARNTPTIKYRSPPSDCFLNSSVSGAHRRDIPAPRAGNTILAEHPELGRIGAAWLSLPQTWSRDTQT